MDYDLVLTYTKHYAPVFIDEVVVDYNDGNNFKRITNSEDGNIQYIYKKHNINIKKYVVPKWLAYIICCFIPKRRNRSGFMINHVKYKQKK